MQESIYNHVNAFWKIYGISYVERILTASYFIVEYLLDI